MTAWIPRRRRWLRIARDEYARSASTVSGRVLGPPGPLRGTRIAGHDGLDGLRASPTRPAEGQGLCMAVADEVDFRTQASAVTTERLIVGLRSRWRPSSFLAPAACWCARQTVESTDTVQSMSSAPSAAAKSAARIRSQVPSTARLIGRL